MLFRSTPLLLCSKQLSKIQEKQKRGELQKRKILSSEVLDQLHQMLDTAKGYSTHFIDEARQFLNNAREALCPDLESSDINKLSEEATLLLLDLLRTRKAKLESIIDLLTHIEQARESAVRIESHLAREVNDQEAQKLWNHIQQFVFL